MEDAHNKTTGEKKRLYRPISEKSLIATIVLACIVIICLVAAYIGCNQIAKTRSIAQMQDAANTVKDQINSKFDRDGDVLKAAARIVGDASIKSDGTLDENAVQSTLEQIGPIQQTMRFRVLLSDGRIFMPKYNNSTDMGEATDFDFADQVEAELNLKTALMTDGTFMPTTDEPYPGHIWNRLTSQLSGNYILAHFVPIVDFAHDNKIVAFLYGVTPLSTLPETLGFFNIYNSEAKVSIIDVASTSKDMIMDTWHDSLGSFNDFADRQTRGKSIEQMQSEVIGLKEGTAEVKSNSTNKWMYIYFMPAKGIVKNKWSIMVMVPYDVVFKNVDSIRTVFIIVGITTIAALIVYFFIMRRHAQQLVKKSVERAVLEEQLHKAEAAERAKTTFLSNMSHDIRTPMNAILGFTTLAETNIDNKERVQDYLKKILSSGNHLLSLINDILDMSRIESGKLNIEEKPCSISDIFKDMRNIIQTQMKSKQLNFFMDTLDVVDEDIFCDKLHLNQILLNLLSNSIKFTPSGGSVSLTIRQKSGAPTGYGAYEIRVKDTGIGMSKEFAEHIFEPFERERTSTVSGIQGTGLGMAITKNIVDTMGGTIEVVTEKGKGTEFIINLQFRLQKECRHYGVIRELEGLRALVVDDNFTTCDSVSKMLMTIGMRSEWTMYGKEAVLRTQQAIDIGDAFSAYIIDWVMPDLSGFEIVRQIRKIVGDEVPIIIVTAYDVTAIMDEAKDIGVTAYCNKPIFMSDLRDTLVSCIQGNNEDSQTRSPEKTEAQKQLIGKRLLLVEDNELNSEIAKEILEESGFKVEVAEDGTVAVEKVRSSAEGYYDLILMDIQMPIMNGYDATRAIRELDEAHRDIPIVAMTANAFDEDRKRALECGMNDHVAKPINIIQLISVIEKLLLPEAEK